MNGNNYSLTPQERNMRKLVLVEALDVLVLDTLSKTSIKSIADLEAASKLYSSYQSARVAINLVAGFTND
jgi:hypothetical protein